MAIYKRNRLSGTNCPLKYFLVLVICVQTVVYSSIETAVATPLAPVSLSEFDSNIHDKTTPDALRIAVLASDFSHQKKRITAQQGNKPSVFLRNIIKQIKIVNADILWLGEIPVDINNKGLNSVIPLLRQLGYDTFFTTDVNSGIQSGFDLDQDDDIDGRDAFGFGVYAGQNGMLVATKNLGIAYNGVRTFQQFLWQDMPDNLLPDNFLPPAAESIVRLSTTSHWDIPIVTKQGKLHFLVSHMTPPVFDGPEDYNGRRNADEIRFWYDYISNTASYIYDDNNTRGGLDKDALFVLGGTFNNDPFDGQGLKYPIRQLLASDLLTDTQPASPVADRLSKKQGGINDIHKGNPALDTADWRDFGKKAAGNLRVDYLLPSSKLVVVNSGVYWPEHLLKNKKENISSTHKIVWIDISYN